MAGGLFALLDDVAMLARLAAASIDDVGAAAGRASVKAAGVVIDDTAVTPQYVQGVAAERELPIVRQIALGSLRNKLIFILPAILLLSQLLPCLLTPLLMAGGTYLCFEATEKIWDRIGPGHAHRRHEAVASPAAAAGPDAEQKMVAGAIRTDFILSAEIMMIALGQVATETFVPRLSILVLVALVITALVYGVVALIVKMDDVGLGLSQRDSTPARRVGRLLVRGMPALLSFLSVAGIAAMLWVGGHILVAGVHELGWQAPYQAAHRLEAAARDLLPAIGELLAWLAGTLVSALAGLGVGAAAVAIRHRLPSRRHG